MKRYIFTGAPGAGKTTTISKFSNMGFSVVKEAATDIIVTEQANGNLKPWEEVSFIKKIIQMQKDRQLSFSISDPHPKKNVQFFDRSPICTYALCNFLGFSYPTLLLKEIERIQAEEIYDKRVFFFENLGYCKNTTIRQINFNDVLKFEQIHREVYSFFNYNCILVPAVAVDLRIQEILKLI